MICIVERWEKKLFARDVDVPDEALDPDGGGAEGVAAHVGDGAFDLVGAIIIALEGHALVVDGDASGQGVADGETGYTELEVEGIGGEVVASESHGLDRVGGDGHGHEQGNQGENYQCE